MNNKRYSKRKPYKGKFPPTNPSKYKGNPRNIIYRSMWERQCMVYFDRNENVLSKFLKPPNTKRKKTKGYLYEVREWGRNSAKWDAAKHYCDKRGWEFSVWTEKTLRM